MVTFNPAKEKKTDAKENRAGGESYDVGPKLELYSAVVTSVLADSYYEGANERLNRIRSLVEEVDDEFVAKLAGFTRNKMYLRSVPLVLVVELARVHSGDSLVSKAVNNVIQRPDEITELLGYWQLANGRTDIKPLSNQIKKGIRQAFHKFDEYQFSKWDDLNRQIRIRDAMFLTRPKAQDEEEDELFEKIAEDELEPPYTWEVELSEVGQQDFDSEKEKEQVFREKWEELIDSERLGYFALLSNLRNILEQDVSFNRIRKVAETISDPERVRNTRILPFRFFSAYKALKDVASTDTNTLLEALEQGAEVAFENVPLFDRDTRALIATDFSGSMRNPISERSSIDLYEIGALLSRGLSQNIDRMIAGIFGTEWQTVNFDAPSILESTVQSANRIGEVGHSTHGHKALQYLLQNDVEVDKLFFFTDEEFWTRSHTSMSFMDLWNRYKGKYHGAELYLFDLAGYGESPVRMNGDDVYQISGWSEQVFEILENLQQGGETLDSVEQYELPDC